MAETSQWQYYGGSIMNMMSSARFYPTILILIFALCWAIPAQSDEALSFKAGYLVLSPEGDFAVSEGTVAGTPIDLETDLGFDDSKEIFFEAGLQFGDFRLSGSYLPIDFSGQGVLVRDLDFNGRSYLSGNLVDSSVQVDLYDVALAWYLVNIDDLPTRLQFGPEFSVKYVDADVSLVDRSAAISESESASVPIPTVGVRGRVALSDFLGFSGRVSYMEYDGNSFTDLDLQVEFSPVPLLGLYAGYRYFDLEVDESDVYVNVTFDGPYLGGLIRF